MKLAFAAQAGLELGNVPSHRSAISVITQHLASRLSERQDVIICTAEHRDDDGDAAGPIMLCPLGYPSPWYSRPFSVIDRISDGSRFIDAFFTTPLYHPRHAVRLALELRKQRADVVHLHNAFQSIPAIRALNPQIKIILHMHCEWLNTARSPLVDAMLEQTTVILGCSDYVAHQICSAHPRVAGRVRTLYNGVDQQCFAPQSAPLSEPTRHQLLYAGRISPEKGLHVLLDAMPEVVAAFPNVQLEILGPPNSQVAWFLTALGDKRVDARLPRFKRYLASPYLAQLRRQAEATAPESVVFSPRSYSHEELSERFQRTTLLVNPSLVETFGMTLIEAMSAGVPVIAAAVGGVPEVIRPGAGILVEPDSPKLLAQAICKALSDPVRTRLMAVQGHRDVLKRFTWDRIVADYLQILDEFELRGTRRVATGMVGAR